jgi:hypothetical protein
MIQMLLLSKMLSKTSPSPPTWLTHTDPPPERGLFATPAMAVKSSLLNHNLPPIINLSSSLEFVESVASPPAHCCIWASRTRHIVPQVVLNKNELK